MSSTNEVCIVGGSRTEFGKLSEMKKVQPRKRLSEREAVDAASYAFDPVMERPRGPIRKMAEVARWVNERRADAGLDRISTETVARHIHRAFHDNLVSVEVRRRRATEVPPRAEGLERKLKTLYGLDEAIVLDCPEKHIRQRSLYETLQAKIGFALAERMAETAEDKFSSTHMKSFGLGGGRTVWSFASRLRAVAPPTFWPNQKVYGLSGSLFENAMWGGEHVAMLDPNSSAGRFANCFSDEAIRRRVGSPLVVPKNELKATLERTKLSEFGRDGLHTVGIFGAGLATMQPHFRQEIEHPEGALYAVRDPLERVLRWATEVDTLYGQQEGYSAIGSITSEWFVVPPHPRLKDAIKLPKLPGQEPKQPVLDAVNEELDRVRERLVSARLAELPQQVNQVYLMGGGFGKASVLDYLATGPFAKKVSILVTSSGTANRLLTWHGIK